MELDYAQLRKEAEKIASIKSALMYPPGNKRDTAYASLTMLYYMQCTTDPTLRNERRLNDKRQPM